MHNQHRVPHPFKVDNRVCCINKQEFQKKHQNLKPIQYGPYTVTRAVGSNTFHLDLPTQLGIHNIVNVNQLKLYELSHNDEDSC